MRVVDRGKGTAIDDRHEGTRSRLFVVYVYLVSEIACVSVEVARCSAALLGPHHPPLPPEVTSFLAILAKSDHVSLTPYFDVIPTIKLPLLVHIPSVEIKYFRVVLSF